MSRLLLLLTLAVAGQSGRERQYLSLAEATLSHPIAPDELRAALLAPSGIGEIGNLFERSIEEGLVLPAPDGLVTPELGGEATLDQGRLVFVSYPDPIHPLLREMLHRENDPVSLLAFLQSSQDGKDVLTSTGGLHALLFRIGSRSPTEEERQLLQKNVASAVLTRFKTWSTDPEIQKRMIETSDWHGRYVGFWHIHPPRIVRDELVEGIEPSVEDMNNAIELGQFLTLVFQPEGFDAYDLSPLAGLPGPDLSRARVVRYRSPDWRSRFEAIARARLHE